MPSTEGFVQACNAQAAVDIDSHMIVENHITQQTNDKQQIEPALDRLIPGRRAPTVPGIANLIMQSMVAGSSQAREQMLQANLADYYQNIHVRGVGMLQFDSVHSAVETGYRESIGPLREWAKRQGLVST